MNTDVTSFIEKIDHPMQDGIRLLRRIILEADGKLTEHIKWNAPSFCCNGDDRITMRLFPAPNLQIIFHRGAKVKSQSKSRLVADCPAFIKWAANDRAIATFSNMKEIGEGKVLLVDFIKHWLRVAG
jgi:hypothetical protein